MTDRAEQRQALLTSILDEDWAQGRASGFARRAARYARRRQRARAALAGATLVALVAASFFVSREGRGTGGSSATRENAPRGYEIISDDQLLAELHDRPLLVMQSANGAREFVLLQE